MNPVVRGLIFVFWLWTVSLPFVEASADPQDLGTCWNYLKQPCNCGICSWFYQLEDVCSAKNLSVCVRGGYYKGGSNQDKCCKANIMKMIIITIIVVAIVACWCCIIAGIVKLKRMQKRKRQRGALDNVDSILLNTGEVAPGTVTYQPGQYADEGDYNFEAASVNNRFSPGLQGNAYDAQVETIARTIVSPRSNPLTDFVDPVKPPNPQSSQSIEATGTKTDKTDKTETE
eukprot:EG_transcript_19288